MGAIFTAVLVLAGCATQQPGSVGGSPTASTSASASTPSAAPDHVPTSRLGLACTDILPAASADLVATGLTAIPFGANPGYATPDAYAVQQRGGLACASSNGIVPERGGGAVGYRGVTVLVLPEAGAQWDRYAAMYPDVLSGTAAAYGDAANVTCYARGAESSCGANILAGGSWIEIEANGIEVDAGLDDAGVAERLTPLFTTVVDAVTASTLTGAAWTPPAGTGALPADCAGYVTADEVRSALDVAVPLVINGPSGGWSLIAGAATQAGVPKCLWTQENSDNGVGLLSALAGGAWAFDASSAILVPGGTAGVVTEPIPGVDRALFRCGPHPDDCTLDTVIAGNWIQLRSYGTPELDSTARKAALISLATTVATRIRAA